MGEKDKAVAQRRRADIILGFGLAAAALAFIFVLVPAGIRVPGRVAHFGLSPAMLPIVTASLIGVFGLLLGLRAVFGRAVPLDVDELSGALLPSWPWRFAAASLLIAAYYPVTQHLGLTLTAVLATAGLMLLAGERRYWLIALLSISVPVSVSWVFERLLYVPVPQPFFLN